MTHRLVVSHVREGESVATELGPHEATSSTDLARILDSLIAEIAGTSHLPPPSLWTFALTSSDGEELDEHEFYAAAGAHPDLHHRLVSILHATESGAHGDRPWADDETPTGSGAVAALVGADRRYIPELVRFLRSCDLDHEVDESQLILDAVERHGWGDDTLSLVAARLGSCAGQFGIEQVEELIEESGLREYLGSPTARRALAAALTAECDRDDVELTSYLSDVRDVLGEFIDSGVVNEIEARAHSRRTRES